MLPAQAACAEHPPLPAVTICGRCGTFACQGCTRGSAERPLCLRCQRLAQAEKPSRQAVAALVLATLGFCGFVPGVAALGLAYAELARIRRGESPASGQSYAELARNLGWFHAAMLAVALLGLFSRFPR